MSPKFFNMARTDAAGVLMVAVLVVAALVVYLGTRD